MKKTIIIGILFIPFLINAQKQLALQGSWTIDLRPTPDSEAYYQVFEVSFYGSTLENGLMNTQWERVYFAFTTSDQSNTYYHSGYLLDGKLYGISYCPGREFTAPWTGIRK